MAHNRKQAGFTIVELLIVIVVIGILAALVITTFTGIQAKHTMRRTASTRHLIT
jgi:prepilin-type N-terminal cleavage/methylation domain-containing protein